MPVSYQQLQARFRVDTLAVDTAATWPVALNAAWVRGSSSDFRIRFTIQTTGSSGTAATSTQNLYVSKNGGAFVPVGGTSGILPSSTASASPNNTVISTGQLAAGAGTYASGYYSATGATPTFVIARGSYSESEFGIAIDPANAKQGDVFQFRVYRGASPQNTYTATPQITVQNITLIPVGSYSLNGQNVTLRRPNISFKLPLWPSDLPPAYAFSIANVVTTSVSHNYPVGPVFGPYGVAGPAMGLTVTKGSTGTINNFYPATGSYSWTGPANVTTSVTPITGVTIPLDHGSYGWTGPAYVIVIPPVSTGPSLDTGYTGYAGAVGNKDESFSAARGNYSYTGSVVTSVNYDHSMSAGSGSYSLTGFQIVGQRRRVAVLSGAAYSLTGLALTFKKNNNSSFGLGVGSYALSGPLPVLAASRTVSLANGPYALTGRPATFSSNRSVSLAFVPYSSAGPALNFRRAARNIPLTTGAYAYAGGLMSFKQGPHTLMATPGGVYAVTGQSLTFKANRNISIAKGSYSLTGPVMTLPKGHTAPLSVGFYSSQGYPIGAKWAHTNPVTTGSYVLTGATMSFSKTGAKSIGLANIPYSLTGSAITFSAAHHLSLNSGAYTLTGYTITVKRGLVDAVATGTYGVFGSLLSVARHASAILAGGSYALTGRPITLTKGALILGSGSYTVTGTVTHLNRSVALYNGSYALTGGAVTFVKVKAPIVLASGSYALTGSAMTLQKTKTMQLNRGSYLTFGPPGMKVLHNGLAGGPTSYGWEILERRRRRA